MSTDFLYCKVQLEVLRFLVLYRAKLHKKNVRGAITEVQYYSCAYSLSQSQKYSYMAYLRGAIRGVKHVLRKGGHTAGSYTRGGGL